MHALSTNSHLYLSVSSSSHKDSVATLRKDLLRKTQKELLKECRKLRLSTNGNKGDIVDRIIKYHSSPKPNGHSPNNKKRKSNKKHERTRSSTICSSSSSSISSSSCSSNDNIDNISLSMTPKIKSKTKKHKISHRGRSQSEASSISFKKLKKCKNTLLLDQNIEEKQENKHMEKQSLSDKSNINIINQFNQRFADHKYDKLRQIIKEHHINCYQLNQINDLTLKILDINDENDRKQLLNGIKNLSNCKSHREKQYGTFYICLFIFNIN